jgi:hypothetical protein
MAPQPVQGTIPGSYGGNYPTGDPNMQSPFIANQGQPAFQQPPSSVGGQNSPAYPAGANAGARPGKRSFLDTIREWFHL